MVLIRTVSRSKSTIRFGERVNDKAIRDFVPVLYETINRGHRDITLDFRRSERAYADAMLPIICLVDYRKGRGNSFRALLPTSQHLAQLFLNCNWAHYLDPQHPKLDMAHRQHLPARRYSSHSEQQDAVNAVVDVVLRNVDLRRDVLSALEWSVNEITDNVLNHAEAPLGGLVQVSTFKEEQKIKFVVADAGRGIPAAMRVAFPKIGNDALAIEEAVKVGVTSIPESGQGNGLAGSLRIATYSDGSFKITSGKAQLNVFKERRTEKYRTKKTHAPRDFRFPGTAVMMELSIASDFAIEEALGLNGTPRVEVPDIVDSRYTSEQGQLVLQMCDESLGFGTRHAGVELRRKCRNLLVAEPGKRLTLDWKDVPLVSSSFADEAIGKLFVELGPSTFLERVANIHAEPLVRSLIDRAIMQRVSQAMQD